MMARLAKLASVAFGAMAALMLSGCGERPQVIDYKQGNYQGKPDEKAWAAAPFNGDKAEWERTIRQRNQSQNEYRRTGG